MAVFEDVEEQTILNLQCDHVGVMTPAGIPKKLHLRAQQVPNRSSSAFLILVEQVRQCNVARLTPMETRPVGKNSPYGVDGQFVCVFHGSSENRVVRRSSATSTEGQRRF